MEGLKYTSRLLLLLSLCWAGACAASEERLTVIDCGYALDLVNKEVLSDVRILVRNDRIEAIGKDLPAPEGALRINEILKEFFAAKNLDLVDFKVEYGRCPAEGGKLLLGDEITPDGCRLWEKGTGRKLDKDRFRRDLGDVEAAYAEVDRLVAE